MRTATSLAEAYDSSRPGAPKRASSDPKDKLRLPMLEATLQRKG